MTGECLYKLVHNHVVHAVAFPNVANPCVVATGGKERKLRIWEFGQSSGVNGNLSMAPGTPSSQPGTNTDTREYEIGANIHGGTIKGLAWTTDPNVIVSICEDFKVRWFDLRVNSPVNAVSLPAEPNSLKLTTQNASNIITVSAGKKVYVYDGTQPGILKKEVTMNYDVASAAIDTKNDVLLTGAVRDTWVHVYDLAQGVETGVFARTF
jgi:serine-threonine kinase receptor-associated protein